MKKIYCLSTCTTCKRILGELEPLDDVEVQDIKFEKITARQIDQMKKMAGSYEALFSRRSRKYQSMGLKNVELGEKDYRKLILDEYTFLKRPVIIIGDQIFVGSAKAEVEGAKNALGR